MSFTAYRDLAVREAGHETFRMLPFRGPAGSCAKCGADCHDYSKMLFSRRVLRRYRRFRPSSWLWPARPEHLAVHCRDCGARYAEEVKL